MDSNLTKSSGYFNEISKIIEQARHRTEIAVNSELVTLYWNIGKIIQTQILYNEKPEYGKSIMQNLSDELVTEYGRGYSVQNLWNMVKFFEVFPDTQILYTLCRELSWSHIRTLIYVKDPLKREFYMTLALNERWSVRELNDRISTALYERTALSKKPETTIANDLEKLRNERKMSTDLFFREPYVLDFLNLKDNYSEKDIENAIISELQNFLLEMGRDLAFHGRQVRISVDGVDYYIDLLFYHRKLRRLVVIELKLDKFKPEFKGQVEFYLKYLEKYEMNEGENPPIGIILCPEKSEVMIELLELDKNNIHVAEFVTKELKDNISKLVERAKLTLEQRNQLND